MPVDTLLKICFLIVSVFAVVVTICGWFYTSHRNHLLQKQRFSVDLMRPLLEGELRESVLFVRQFMRANPTYDWNALPEKHSNNKLNSDEQKLFNKVGQVLDVFEFIAVAIKVDLVDEYLIKQTWRTFLVQSYAHLQGYVNCTRRIAQSSSVYSNYERLVQEWHNETQTSKPEN